MRQVCDNARGCGECNDTEACSRAPPLCSVAAHPDVERPVSHNLEAYHELIARSGYNAHRTHGVSSCGVELHEVAVIPSRGREWRERPHRHGACDH